LFFYFFFSSFAEGTIFDAHGKPSHEIIRIFRHAKPDLNLKQDVSLERLSQIAQDSFLRPRGSERLSPEACDFYHTRFGSLSGEKQKIILESFRKIGVLDARYPSSKNPDYILIHGSTVSNLRARLRFLASLVTEGKISLSESTHLIFLLGDRALFSSETEDELVRPAFVALEADWHPPEKLPENERDLGEFLWHQLVLPRELKKISPRFIKAPKKEGNARAQTEDCVQIFINETSHYFPEKALFLVISTNPFVDYQKRTTELAFYSQGLRGYRFEAAGDKAPVESELPAVTMGILMDNLARALHTEMQFLK
jgi:hypothetical protein